MKTLLKDAQLYLEEHMLGVSVLCLGVLLLPLIPFPYFLIFLGGAVANGLVALPLFLALLVDAYLTAWLLDLPLVHVAGVVLCLVMRMVYLHFFVTRRYTHLYE